MKFSVLLSLLVAARVAVAGPCKPRYNSLQDPKPIILVASCSRGLLGSDIYGYNLAMRGYSRTFYIDFQDSPEAAVRFGVRDDGSVIALSGPGSQEFAFYSTENGPSSLVLVADQDTATANRGTRMTCALNNKGVFACTFSDRLAEFWLCGGHLHVVRPGYDFTNHCAHGAAHRIALKGLRAS